MTHGAKEVARIITELREDDARMTPAPWIGGSDAVFVGSCPILEAAAQDHEANCAGIARLRNNARAIADQLEAQQMEIERLKRDVIGNVERLTKVQDMLVAERDALRAEVEQLRQGLHPDGSGRYDALLVERRKRQEDLELADRTAAEQVKHIDGLTAQRYRFEEMARVAANARDVARVEIERLNEVLIDTAADAHFEIERLRPIVESSVALRESEATEAGTAEMSIAQLEPLAEAARKRTHDSLIRWRTAVDAYRAEKEKP